ncbi:ABC transporter permease [Anabaena subtropica]|uniref:ABC transporter permease n=1 Tax=Anabaena subtropica FACHB-260 TaxID=2692884 RepID=A0ABR8CLZ3_9NOST|nr:ABC transporter permease [Anabaena subtropica]MBD2343182.1 ABC transporter permease [Anabaena subtropica FACHB-260]
MGNQVVIIAGTFILLLTGLLLGYVLSQLVLGFLAFNLLTFFGTISLILIFGTLYYVLFWQLKREQTQVLPAEMPTQLETQTQTPTIPENHLKNKLISRLSGDVESAERLIEQARQNYPGMPDNWYCERVLDDLDRDTR